MWRAFGGGLRRTAAIAFAAGVLGGCRRPASVHADAPAVPRDAGPPVMAASPTTKSFYAQSFSRRPRPDEMTELGRALFADPQLSAFGNMSCASCHAPKFAYGPPNDRATQLGGPALKTPGLRAAPSLRYLQAVPSFSEHHYDESADDSLDQGPTGGHDWDGRAASAHEQARGPLTSPFEMANPDVETVVARLARGPLAARFRAVFGDDVFREANRGTAALLMCLEVFQQSPKDFSPFSSRYDRYLAHQGTLTPAEQRGLALFNDAKKGNCAACHPSGLRKGAFPLFTDFGFGALAVPRNRALPANADPAFHDLGLCGPVRTDLAGHPDYCGQFRVPSLRNVALRRAFFHNGVFHRLDQVLDFYAERDTNPRRFYPRTGGAFDDLPAAYAKNANREPPFGGKPGAAPALTRAERRDIVSFLQALTDADLAR
ncbi:MAG TPA: cytochrome c peroxidase [Polyangia bacterium]|nr:cytochrome c peroxidase [Polyangia bacterium]